MLGITSNHPYARSKSEMLLNHMKVQWDFKSTWSPAVVKMHYMQEKIKDTL